MGKVIDCQPVGCYILIERLTDQEILGTKLHLIDNGKSKDNGLPQGVILAIGNGFDEDTLKRYGIKVGDRVLLQGICHPVPSYGTGNRVKELVDISTIKAILKEEVNE